MVDKEEDAGQSSGPADGRRRRQPPTIDVKAVEMPVTDAASAGSSSEAARIGLPAAGRPLPHAMASRPGRGHARCRARRPRGRRRVDRRCPAR